MKWYEEMMDLSNKRTSPVMLRLDIQTVQNVSTEWLQNWLRGTLAKRHQPACDPKGKPIPGAPRQHVFGPAWRAIQLLRLKYAVDNMSPAELEKYLA